VTKGLFGLVAAAAQLVEVERAVSAMAMTAIARLTGR
jgi:hypothetical protein